MVFRSAARLLGVAVLGEGLVLVKNFRPGPCWGTFHGPDTPPIAGRDNTESSGTWLVEGQSGALVPLGG